MQIVLSNFRLSFFGTAAGEVSEQVENLRSVGGEDFCREPVFSTTGRDLCPICPYVLQQTAVSAELYVTLPVPGGPAMDYLQGLARNDPCGSRFATGMVDTV